MAVQQGKVLSATPPRCLFLDNLSTDFWLEPSNAQYGTAAKHALRGKTSVSPNVTDQPSSSSLDSAVAEAPGLKWPFPEFYNSATPPPPAPPRPSPPSSPPKNRTKRPSRIPEKHDTVRSPGAALSVLPRAARPMLICRRRAGTTCVQLAGAATTFGAVLVIGRHFVNASGRQHASWAICVCCLSLTLNPKTNTMSPNSPHVTAFLFLLLLPRQTSGCVSARKRLDGH